MTYARTITASVGCAILFATSLFAQTASEIGLWAEGSAASVTTSGDVAYYTNGWWLETADISDPANPVALGRLSLGGEARKLVPHGDVLYGWMNTGFQVINVANPSEPQMGGMISTAVFTMDKFGDSLFIGTFNGVEIYDVSTPASPVYQSKIDVGTFVSALALSDSLLIVESPRNQVQIYNLADPSNPDSLTAFQLNTVNAFAVRGNRLYIGGDSLYVMDISNPAAVSQVSAQRNYSWTMAMRDNYLYVYDANASTRIFDLADPDFPVDSGFWFSRLNGTVSFGGSGQASFHDGRLVITRRELGIHILNVDDPANVVSEGLIRTAGYHQNLELAGDELIVSSGAGGINVLDVSDQTRPVLLQRLNTISAVYQTVTMDDHMLVAGNPASILERGADGWEVLAELEFSAKSIVVRGDTAIFALREAIAVDISDPVNPVEVGRFGTFSFVRDMTQRGDNIFVADGNNGVSVFDVSSLSAATQLTTIDQPANAEGLYVDGETLVIGSRVQDVHFVDVSDAAAPTVIGTAGSSGYNAFARATDFLLGIQSSSGIAAYDASAAAPDFTNIAPVPFSGTALVVDNDILFASSSNSGISVLQLEGIDTASEDLHPGIANWEVSSYPNPFVDVVGMSIDLAAAAQYQVAIHDVMGRLVRVVFHGDLPAGKTNFQWDGRGRSGANLAPGTYILTVRSESDARSIPIVKVR